MARSPHQMRTITTAMMIMGIVVELIAIGFMVFGDGGPAALAVMIAGLMLVMLAVVFRAQDGK